MELSNSQFRTKISHGIDYGTWYSIDFKPGHELFANGIKYKSVYGTPYNDTYPSDPDSEISPTRGFDILCDFKPNGYPTGQMTNIPGITSITLTKNNTEAITGRGVVGARPPEDWESPEIRTMYGEPHLERFPEESTLFKKRRVSKDGTAATLPETAATLPPSPFSWVREGGRKSKKKKNKRKKSKRR